MQTYLLYLLNLYSQGMFSIKSLENILFIHLAFNPCNISIKNENKILFLITKIERFSNNQSDLLNYSDIYLSERDIQKIIAKVFGIKKFSGLLEEKQRYQELKNSLLEGSLFPYDALLIFKYDFNLEEVNLLIQELEYDISTQKNVIDWKSVKEQILFILE